VKSLIKSSLALEPEATHTVIVKTFCVAVNLLSSLFAIHSTLIEDTYADTLVLATFEAHPQTLFKHSGFSCPQCFEGLNLFADYHDIHVAGHIEDGDVAHVAPCIPAFKDLIGCLFVRPWDAYLGATAQNDRLLKVQKRVEEHNKNSSTSATAIDFEETTADGDNIREAVLTVIQQETKRLQQQINKLSQQLRSAPKNLPGGGIVPPKTKTKNKKPKPTNQSKQNGSHVGKQAAPRVAVVASGPANESGKTANSKRDLTNIGSQRRNKK
jgi:hypothetical protein